jgi:hypothetical protein
LWWEPALITRHDIASCLMMRLGICFLVLPDIRNGCVRLGEHVLTCHEAGWVCLARWACLDVSWFWESMSTDILILRKCFKMCHQHRESCLDFSLASLCWCLWLSVILSYQYYIIWSVINFFSHKACTWYVTNMWLLQEYGKACKDMSWGWGSM